MSLFFFRLHTVRAWRRAEGRPKKKLRTPTALMVGCAGTLPMRRPNSNVNSSSMYERPPVTPSDSLDEVAFKIPRLQEEKNLKVATLNLLHAPVQCAAIMLISLLLMLLLLSLICCAVERKEISYLFRLAAETDTLKRTLLK